MAAAVEPGALPGGGPDPVVVHRPGRRLARPVRGRARPSGSVRWPRRASWGHAAPGRASGWPGLGSREPGGWGSPHGRGVDGDAPLPPAVGAASGLTGPGGGPLVAPRGLASRRPRGAPRAVAPTGAEAPCHGEPRVPRGLTGWVAEPTGERPVPRGAEPGSTRPARTGFEGGTTSSRTVPVAALASLAARFRTATWCATGHRPCWATPRPGPGTVEDAAAGAGAEVSDCVPRPRTAWG